MSLSAPLPSIADLMARLTLLPIALQGPVGVLLKTAEFRSARTIFDQIKVLRSGASLSWDYISVLYDIPKTTLHRRWKQFRVESESVAEFPPPSDPQQAPHANLNPRQENELIQWIHQRQKASRCPTVHEVREKAAIIASSKPDAEPFTKYWWRSFKRRHTAEIETQILDAREAARTKVKTEDVLNYFGQVVGALRRIRSLHQVLNMDESGFSGRIDKGRKRKCVVAKSCPAAPAFQEDDGSSQLSIVSTITLGGAALPAMFITKEHIKLNGNFANDSIFDKSLHFVTPKGYQTEASMVFWITNCLTPYALGLQTQLGDANAPVFLIMDNCSVHNTAAVQQAFKNVRDLEIIWMPPHSSHFLQMLDASYFGVMKGEYRRGKTSKQKPKVAGKLIRAYRAAWIASHPTTIMRSWELTGFRYTDLGTPKVGACLDLTAIIAVAEANCQDFDVFVGAPWQ